MHIKNHLISALIFIVAGMTWANSAFAWEATIYAQGEVVGVDINKSDVTIGVEGTAERGPSPPPALDYTVNMDLMNRPNDGDPDDDYVDYDFLKKDIRQAVGGAATHIWILQIDPNGNAVPSFQARTSTISWDPAEFGSGDFEMREGFDGTGPVVVADMKTTTSYPVTGTADTQFTIHFTTASIPPVILLFLLVD
jgi:hypothetical protein